MKKFIVTLLIVFFSSISFAHIGHYNKFNKIEPGINFDLNLNAGSSFTLDAERYRGCLVQNFIPLGETLNTGVNYTIYITINNDYMNFVMIAYPKELNDEFTALKF